MRYEAGNIETPKSDISTSGLKNRWSGILLNKFSAPQVIFTIIITAAIMVFTMSQGDMVTGNLLVIAIIGLIVVYGVLASAKFGISILFVTGYLLSIPGKLSGIDFPIGTLLDGLEFLLILGFFFRQKYRRDFKIFKDPLSYAIMAWILYNFAELGNPEVVSREAWFYTIRSTALIILTYYIFVYEIRDIRFIKFMFKLWLGLALFAAADGFHQEVFDFFPFERKWLYSDPLRVQLLFQGGHMRKFSIFSDPVAFGYNMAAAATLCIGLLFGPYKTYKKVFLVAMIGFFLLNMIFSGTRGAFPLIPGAVLLLAILKFNKRVLLFSVVCAVLFAGLIFMPSGNQNIMRFQSAFKPNNDASFSVRKINQARIRPYIQSHPMGGGLGTTGYWGERFSPNTMLANFPPDSGYVRVAVEAGTLGLLVICIMIFVALRTGINNYYLIKDGELKTICMTMTMVVFIYNIANYPQEAFAQFPSNIIFFFCIALITITRNLDKQQLELAAHDER